jgi:hypothetical protein
MLLVAWLRSLLPIEPTENDEITFVFETVHITYLVHSQAISRIHQLLLYMYISWGQEPLYIPILPTMKLQSRPINNNKQSNYATTRLEFRRCTATWIILSVHITIRD